MRIAFSGAHQTGKTSLIEEVLRSLPRYTALEEPYHQLEEEGHEQAEIPSLEDFELQLQRSLDDLADSDGDQLFDRCPADIIAYLLTHEDADGFDLEPWIEPVRGAMLRLDLIVYVPIEDPDRIAARKDPWRLRVDEELRGILLDDRFDLGLDVIEVTGSLPERARQVLARVGAARRS